MFEFILCLPPLPFHLLVPGLLCPPPAIPLAASFSSCRCQLNATSSSGLLSPHKNTRCLPSPAFTFDHITCFIIFIAPHISQYVFSLMCVFYLLLLEFTKALSRAFVTTESRRKPGTHFCQVFVDWLADPLSSLGARWTVELMVMKELDLWSQAGWV